MIAKGTAAVGGPLALLLIGLLGYKPAEKHNTDLAILGFKFVNAILPALMVIPSVYLLWTFPITERRQGIIRRRLQSRAAARQARREAAEA